METERADQTTNRGRAPVAGVLAGLTAGAAATVPMTVLMRSGLRLLPRHDRYPLPPEHVTDRVSRLVGSSAGLLRPGWAAKTYVAHFGFGAAAGAVYAATASRLTGPPAVRGGLFGIGVWATSYLGWLPATGLFPAATQEPAGRNAVMLAAHVVWGAAVGLVADRLLRRRAAGDDGVPRSHRPAADAPTDGRDTAALKPPRRPAGGGPSAPAIRGRGALAAAVRRASPRVGPSSG